MNSLLRHLRRAALADDGDGQLLERFLARRDEAAFEALVRRHGPMVLGVCRRVLSNAHDADDAFQAVFLVLVREAASIQPRSLVGNWLYGVAYRTALEARGILARRRAKERQVHAMPESGAPPGGDDAGITRAHGKELGRTPGTLHVTIVGC